MFLILMLDFMDWSNDQGESNMDKKDPLDVSEDLGKDISFKTQYLVKRSINHSLVYKN